jgi:hypothetical protein
MVVVEDAQRFDGVGDGDATIPDEQEVLSVLGIGRRREVVGAKVDTGGRLVEVDDGELVVHADPAAARRLPEKGNGTSPVSWDG